MEFFTDTLIELSGLDGVVKEVSDQLFRPIDIDVQIGNTSKLIEATGWKPEYDIRTTLGDLLNYWVTKLGRSTQVKG